MAVKFRRRQGGKMSIKCGNHAGYDVRHESVAEVRACFASGAKAPEQLTAPAPAETIAEINADQETWPWTYRKGRDPHAFDLGRRYAETLAEIGIKPDESASRDAMTVEFSGISPERTERYQTAYPLRTGSVATERQTGFIRLLLAEREWGMENLDGALFERAMDVLGEKDITKEEASALIPALKALPKKEAKRPEAKEQPWRVLSRQVPAGYYAVTDQAGKNHFYRVSVGRNDFYKVQEQASDDLHFVSLNRYAGILQAIVDFGLDNAGKLYATERGCCRRCNRTLTDNTGNPYFELGYGPDCGGK